MTCPAACLVVLSFLIWRTDDDHAAEAGEVTARSCAIAEQYMRDGLREGQRLFVMACEVRR